VARRVPATRGPPARTHGRQPDRRARCHTAGTGGRAGAGGVDAVPGPGPEERLQQSESRRRLLAALRTLPERDRDVLALKFAGHQTHVAIAELVGLSESHVSVVVYRAVRKLREQLGEPEEARHA
jgi:RNA polymerase sigma factor (sigma-70 family)